jgi:hypothetical protein
MSGKRVNAKTGNGVCFNQHIDSDLHGFALQTSSLQTFNSNAQNCHNKINTYLLFIQFHHFPCLALNYLVLRVAMSQLGTSLNSHNDAKRVVILQYILHVSQTYAINGFQEMLVYANMHPTSLKRICLGRNDVASGASFY